MPQRPGGAPGGRAGRVQGTADRRQRDARRDEDGHQHDGDQQDGGAGGAQPGVEGTADDGAEVATGVAQGVGGRQRRRALGHLGQAADAEQAEQRADGQPPRVGALDILLVVEPTPAVEQEREAGAGGDQREQDAGPAREERQARVGAVADGAELLAPQRQRQQDAERDQPDGPQVPGLDPPERRPRGLGLPGPGGRFLRGGARGRTRRGASAGLGHHSEAEISA